jgi:hypothetical protein
MKRIFAMLTILFLSVTAQAFIPPKPLMFTNTMLDDVNSNQSTKVDDWKLEYRDRMNTLFSGITSAEDANIAASSSKGWTFLTKIRNHHDDGNFQTAYEYTRDILKHVFIDRYGSGYNSVVNSRPKSSNTGKYLNAFLTTDKNQYGISQFILETALACRWYQSSTNNRNKTCKSLPYLKLVGLRLAFEELYDRGHELVESDFVAGFVSQNHVDLNRGMLLARAATPVFLSTTINGGSATYTGIWGNNLAITVDGSTSTKTMTTHFEDLLVKYMIEFNGGLKDFFAHLFIEKHNGTASNFFSSYNPDDAIVDCETQRVSQANWIKRCTNNQVMATFLGRFIVRTLRNAGTVTLNKSIDNFKDMILKGIYDQSGGFWQISDYYRTPSGLSYASLQFKLLTIAAEISLNLGATNLYTHESGALINGLNSISELMNDIDSYSSFSTHRTSLQSKEYCKYINTDSSDTDCSSLSINPVSSSWQRNNGYIAVAYKRFCVDLESTNGASTSRLCKTPSTASGFKHYVPFPTTDPGYSNFVGSDLEGVYFGPTQLLYLQDSDL